MSEFLSCEDGEKGQIFLEWVERNGFEVVVFDMDHTMSVAHCGGGLRREELAEYVSKASEDFITAVNSLKTINFRCAVATGSDPVEYDLPEQSRESHILGPDLATAVITHHCPDAIDMFGIMVGYDDRLHPNEGDTTVNSKGKRQHMRRIQQHYDVPFHKMVLFDDSLGSLCSEDGWVGVKVNPSTGFKFNDIPSSFPLYLDANGYCNDTMTLPTVNVGETVRLYNRMFGMREVERIEDKTVVIEREGAKLGFVVNGGDATNTGADIRVSDIYRARSELMLLGIEIQNWRVDERGGKQFQVFFVGSEDGLCFCFNAVI